MGKFKFCLLEGMTNELAMFLPSTIKATLALFVMITGIWLMLWLCADNLAGKMEQQYAHHSLVMFLELLPWMMCNVMDQRPLFKNVLILFLIIALLTKGRELNAFDKFMLYLKKTKLS